MTTTYDYGDQVRVTCTFTNLAGSAADPTGITFKWRTPAGTTSSYVYGTDAELVKSATGIYYVDLTLNVEGTWYYRFEGTGALVAADEGHLLVKDSAFY